MSYLNETVVNFIGLMPVTLVQSLILSFVVLAIMLPFRVLAFPDLTCEGSYPLGGCACAALMAIGVSAVTATVAAALLGIVAGCCTAYIHLRFRIHTLLAGILMLTMLYSVNLRIMGRSNVSIFEAATVYDLVGPDGAASLGNKAVVASALVALALVALMAFFRTEQGMGMRAVGSNAEMAQAQGINVWAATIAGVGLAGGAAALGGALMVQSQGFGDVSMGLGMLVNGLAALMIGEALLGIHTVRRQLLTPVVGAFVFYQLVSLCLAAGMPPPDLKFLTGFFVLAMLAMPTLRRAGKLSTSRESVRG